MTGTNARGSRRSVLQPSAYLGAAIPSSGAAPARRYSRPVRRGSPMRVHRGYLFWGVFFVLLGAVPLADRLGLLAIDDLGGLGRLWPLAIIAIGVAVLVSRSRVALLGPLAAGLVLGSLAGVALASGAGSLFGAGGG